MHRLELGHRPPQELVQSRLLEVAVEQSCANKSVSTPLEDPGALLGRRFMPHHRLATRVHASSRHGCNHVVCTLCLETVSSTLRRLRRILYANPDAPDSPPQRFRICAPRAARRTRDPIPAVKSVRLPGNCHTWFRPEIKQALCTNGHCPLSQKGTWSCRGPSVLIFWAEDPVSSGLVLVALVKG